MVTLTPPHRLPACGVKEKTTESVSVKIKRDCNHCKGKNVSLCHHDRAAETGLLTVFGSTFFNEFMGDLPQSLMCTI